MQLLAFALLLCAMSAAVMAVVSGAQRSPSPSPPSPASPTPSAPFVPPAHPPPPKGVYGPYFPSCTGACGNCLKPGWCQEGGRCGQCACLDGKVCVPADTISCAGAHGSVVTPHDQDVPGGQVHLACTLGPDGGPLWLPRCDAPYVCPGEGWLCDTTRAYSTVNGHEVSLCRPK